MTTPALLIHGEKDRLSDVQGSRWLFETMRASDKRLIVYPGGYHEPHNDVDHVQVANDIAAWMEERLHACGGDQHI
jgi:alpha-beta hydrolase superfamily lysophospholipase